VIGLAPILLAAAVAIEPSLIAMRAGSHPRAVTGFALRPDAFAAPVRIEPSAERLFQSPERPAPSAERPPPPSASAGHAQSSEVIAEIRVHGNLIVTNDDVLAIAGVSLGAPFTATTVQDVAARLRTSKKFDEVQVLKRFASIEDPSQIALVIIVNEGPVKLERSGETLSVVRRRGVENLMFLPILYAEDGYGLTYGVRFAVVNKAGAQSRVSFPLTWGGYKRAAVELERRFTAGPFTRAELGAGIERRTNPAYLQDDSRKRAWGRLERAMGPVRVRGSASWQRVSFAAITDDVRTVGAELIFDTRVDPVLPRNAVYASVGIDHSAFGSRGPANIVTLEGNGYIGLVGQLVLALHLSRESGDRPLPPYLKPLFGGWSSVRGYPAGAFAADTVVVESAELRVPLSSPLRIVKLGTSIFVDTGKAYDFGQRYAEQPLRTGVGAGVWMTATVFHLGLSVAHANNGDTRVNFGGGFTF
jgi:outer membrane protein assembly factor BamA